MTELRAWTLISKATNRQYAGNHGYGDRPRRSYQYDNHVANSQNVSEGDLALIRNSERLLGIARIERVTRRPGTKRMLRCPRCGISGVKTRRRKLPRFRCDRGHEFPKRREEVVRVNRYQAHFGNSFVPVDDWVPAAEVKAAALRPSDQVSIEEIDISRISRRIAALNPAARSLLAQFRRKEAPDNDLLYDDRSYWVVSPNVKNDKSTVDDWRRASVSVHAAFMGWGPDDPGHGGIGPAFAGKSKSGIKSGDVILIARRHRRRPEVVGFGVVSGRALTRMNGLRTPDEFGSLRRLKPFRAWSRPPPGVPFSQVVRHVRALVRLHPERSHAHRKVCAWLAERLRHPPQHIDGKQAAGRRSGSRRGRQSNGAIASGGNFQLDWTIQTPARVIRAQAREARLLADYQKWLSVQNREAPPFRYGTLRCDALEEAENNLIEAKSSIRREHIRMAVGQLLDYAFRAKENRCVLNKAVLLPRRPPSEILRWLDSINIKVIWRAKGSFVDNANGRFT